MECVHIAIACPYKDLAGHFCMQVQVHAKARSIKESVHRNFGGLRTHFQAFMNPAEIFSEVGLSKL